jgi:ABC-type Zn uptake system ZnuABC Zn-binding protein ZnuA
LDFVYSTSWKIISHLLLMHFVVLYLYFLIQATLNAKKFYIVFKNFFWERVTKDIIYDKISVYNQIIINVVFQS